jgi:hypothetical protein
MDHFGLRRVDNTDHTALAVLALCAVEPDGCRGVLDFIREGGVGESLGASSRNESRPETIRHGLARRVEGRLGDGVVLGPEVESDGVTLSGSKVAGDELQSAHLVTDNNLVVFRESSASEGSGEDGSGEKHFG